ncbi:hypothetical protein GGR57DRAFT_455920 [Xylariaceae sp. FL1272]|nr:hypothetical protein GGR57DRAFT_455920 [Xylariaceae sp. FL1272]
MSNLKRHDSLPIEAGVADCPPPKKRRRNPYQVTLNELADMKWRDAICEALDIDPSVTDENLQKAISCIPKDVSDISEDEAPPFPAREPFFTNLYRITCTRIERSSHQIYEDKPFIQTTDGKDRHLAANHRVTSFDSYMLRNPGLSFAVIHEYICCTVSNSLVMSNLSGIGTKCDESLFIASTDLSTALSKLTSSFTVDEAWMPSCTALEVSRHWESWAFQHPECAQTFPTLCDPSQKKHALLFTDHFLVPKISEFEDIRKLLAGGSFNRHCLRYLFVPGNTYVIKSERGEAYDRCYTLEAWPKLDRSWAPKPTSTDTLPYSHQISLELSLGSWLFDGNFMQGEERAVYHIDVTRDVNPICALPITPLELISEERRLALRTRGEMFWKCRKSKYVTYHGWDYERLEYFHYQRFMIDSEKSRHFYRYNNQNPQQALPELTDHLGPFTMAQSDPPGERFSLTAPLFVWGFNFNDKLWKKLAIAYVKEVDWDEQAFDNLVMDPDSKDVVQSLVANKVQNSVSTDLIRGKGNGIILLLHGPPGTGKTLTAESVAEHAKKPLYRVTCGDIGTKPEAVEKYLKQVLMLGKSWDCVILLDEAEVFLQERSLENIGRNALVSVFLRHLEYYDGILILTSNRVGTIDEGFRSRIQLAIHYPKLEQLERRRVWDIFVGRLSDDPIASMDIDVRNLRSNLTELSKFNLNGREIRNSINVARPLAKAEGRKVDFDSLKKVIRVQQKFEGYVKDMNEGLDDEKVAREVGKR